MKREERKGMGGGEERRGEGGGGVVFYYTLPLRQTEKMLTQLIHWIRVGDGGLGIPKLPGVSSSQELGRPMILLNMVTEFCG